MPQGSSSSDKARLLIAEQLQEPQAAAEAEEEGADDMLTVSTQRVNPFKVMALIGVMAVVGIMAGVAGDKILRSKGSNERSWLQLVAKEKAAKQLRASSHSSHEAPKAHSNVTKASNATPASACRNAVQGEACYNAVLWHKWIGVVENPGGYPHGVWRGSDRATIQQWLHDTKQSECPKPCFDEAYPVPAKKAKGSPSIYCFSVARAGPEIDTMYMQRQSGTGIFACDGHAVYSNTNTTIDGIRTIPIGNTDSGLSVDHTAANSQVFMRTWMTLLNNNEWWHYDFVAKVDPDAVLFPERMRGHLSWHVGQPVFFLNCAKWHPMMYGALEVFSKQALGRYLAQHGKCESGLPFWSWGEDKYMGTCLEILGVQAQPDYGNFLHDERCWGVDCGNKAAVAFHAFKAVNSWYRCFLASS